nr:uncharacterized protein LOC102149515 isoform X2 [Equus caballus]XP_023490691.1 uncharacterized protein LOC102149515 isoform X2 [Equus caballus]
MFACCGPVFRGSRLRKAQSVRLLCCCRSWLNPHPRSHRPFGRRYPKNSTQEIFEELCDGFDFSPSLVKRQEQQATSSILCRSEEPTLSVAEARTMLTLKAGAVQKVVGCLQPSFHGRSISVTTFPCVYQAFYPTPQVLDQLLQSALSPIWGPRPQENSQDMWQMLPLQDQPDVGVSPGPLAWLSPEAPGHPSSHPGGPFPGH